jgi:hypothetical protein
VTDGPDRNLLGPWTPWIAGLVLLAVAGGAVVLWRATGRDREPADLDEAFVYDVDRYRTIPPERIGWTQTARLETGLAEPTAVAVGPDDRIAVAGDERVLVLSREGERLADLAVPATPYALASAAGDLFVATESRVARCAFREPLAWIIDVPGERARITSLAVDPGGLYVADAGSRGVWRFGLDGAPRGRIGDRDPGRDIPGFNVPSPYFDLLAAPDGLLRVVDPGRHRICAFTAEGDLEIFWGRPSFELEGFSGCCNPSHLAVLPDGRFVTSEKGLPRIKVYDVDGSFQSAVVGPDGLTTATEPCDVAVDSRGRIVALDPGGGAVRIFEEKERR